MTHPSANLHALAERSVPSLVPTPLAAAFANTGIQLPIPFLDLSAQVIRDLPLENVADLQRFIADAKSELATLTNMVQTGLELRFGEAAKAQLRASGRDTGTVHLEDDGFDIGVDVDKTVAWDQNDLSAKWDRIGASGANFIVASYQQVAAAPERYRRLSLSLHPIPRDVHAEHQGIFDATMARDAEKATALLTEHIVSTFRSLKALPEMGEQG